MSAQSLPRALADLWWALDEIPMPSDAAVVRDIVIEALQALNPRGTLNLGLRRLRGRRQVLERVRTWLESPEIVRAANSGGAAWSHRVWADAVEAMLGGVKPSEAFGMSAKGRRPSMGFSAADNVAAWVEHQVRQGQPPGAVHEIVRTHLKSRAPADQVIYAKRAKLTRRLSDPDIHEMAKCAAIMEGLPRP